MKKTVLVTGSSRGIGKEIIKKFAQHDYNVVINYLNSKEEAYKLKEYLTTNYNIASLCIKCDISKEEEVSKMIEETISNFGCIDVLVNNASICNDTILFDKSVEDWKNVLNTNLIGTYLCSKYASKYMKTGSIINISSTNGLDTYYPYSAEYDASKAGVISLTHNLAVELAPNIRVNCICPGWVNTDMNKDLSKEQIKEELSHILLQRFAKPDEIADVAYFLSNATYINNAIIRVDGGLSNG